MEPQVKSARRSPPGQRFLPVAEQEVQAALPELAGGLPGASRHGYLCIREMAGPFGIADAVVIVGGLSRLDERLEAEVPPLLNSLDVAITALLFPGRALPVDHVAAEISRPLKVVRQRMRSLAGLGAVRAKSVGWVRHPSLVPCGRLHALEAKVKDWSRGAEQAAKYSAWADTASVVIQQLPADPSGCVAKASNLGIGVVHDGVWKCRPELRQHFAARRLWATEHVVAALRT